MTKLCPRGKAAAKRKFAVYPSAYANAYASKICAGKIKDPSGVKRKDFRGSKAEGGLMEATERLKRQGLRGGGMDPKQKDRKKASLQNLSGKKKKKPILIIGGKKFNVIPGSENSYSILDKGVPLADVEVIEKKAKGGRAGFKAGSKGCKLAMKGKGRAYGKNS